MVGSIPLLYSGNLFRMLVFETLIGQPSLGTKVLRVLALLSMILLTTILALDLAPVFTNLTVTTASRGLYMNNLTPTDRVLHQGDAGSPSTVPRASSDFITLLRGALGLR